MTDPTAQPNPNYARAIRTCRGWREMRQDELADLAGVSKSHISLLESGKRNPSPKMEKKIAGALRVPVQLFAALSGDWRAVQTLIRLSRSMHVSELIDVLVHGLNNE